MPVNKFRHEGLEIYFVDYTDCKSQKDLIEVVSETARLYEEEPEGKNLYSLVLSQLLNVGYSLLSLIRESIVVNLQFIFASF